MARGEGEREEAWPEEEPLFPGCCGMVKGFRSKTVVGGDTEFMADRDGREGGEGRDGGEEGEVVALGE